MKTEEISKSKASINPLALVGIALWIASIFAGVPIFVNLSVSIVCAVLINYLWLAAKEYLMIRAKKETKSSTNQELINKLNWVLITVMALLIFCKYLFDPSMRIFDLFPFAFGNRS